MFNNEPRDQLLISAALFNMAKAA